MGGCVIHILGSEKVNLELDFRPVRRTGPIDCYNDQ